MKKAFCCYGTPKAKAIEEVEDSKNDNHKEKTDEE